MIFMLSEAATLEHMILIGYLFTAFSMKTGESEGLTEKQADAVERWTKTIEHVAEQEMLHLALVNNMLTSVGAAPHFDRPNFPQPAKYFSPGIQLALMPFGEEALRVFLHLERPEGMAIEGVPGFEVRDASKPTLDGDELVPEQQYYATVGNLYRGIEEGFRNLVEKYGESKVFIGSARRQATEEYFELPNLVGVGDLNSAVKAIETIVTEGEGARGDWKKAHFGKFAGILNELQEFKRKDPRFEPARPVVAAYVNPPRGVDTAEVITEPSTAGVADLFNGTYEVLLQMLSRFFLPADAKKVDLEIISSSVVDIMEGVIKPLGILLTSLPVGPNLPGLNAGPTFEMYKRGYILPQRREAWIILHERLTELAETAEKLEPKFPESSGLGPVVGQFRKLAATFEVLPT